MSELLQLFFIQGDQNAKTGPDAYEQWPGTVGRFGVGETNERGERLIEFAHRHKMTMVNTLFPQKNSVAFARWHHTQPDRLYYRTTVQHHRFKSSINRAKSRTFPGADINSDHDLVIITMKLKLKQNLRSHGSRLKFNLEKRKDPEVADRFEATIGGQICST